MALQGSFETIALRDVMTLLASSNKSGELRVVGGQVEGRLWLQGGRLVGSKVGRSHGHVDALFELLRLTEGNFVFKDGVDAPEPEEATPVEPVMHEAEERLKEWHDIEVVVPSLEHRVRLIPELPTAEVTLTAEEWHLVMAVAVAASVRGVLEELGLGQFEACRGIARLVAAGLVLVEPPRIRPSIADPVRAARRAAAGQASPAAGDEPGPSDYHAVAAPDVLSRPPRVVHPPPPPPLALVADASPVLSAGSAAGLAGGLAGISRLVTPEPSEAPSDGEPILIRGRRPELSPFEAALGPAVRFPDDGDSFPPNYDDLGVVHHFPSREEDDLALPLARAEASRQAFTNGQEMTNGNGGTNGTQLTNGNGLINGTEVTNGDGADGNGRDPGSDTINRGLLLKFLSSVRS